MAAAERKGVSNASVLLPSFQTSSSWRLRRPFCRQPNKASTLAKLKQQRRGPSGPRLFFELAGESGFFRWENWLVVGTSQRRRSRGIANHQLRIHLVPRNIPIAFLKAGIHAFHNDVHGVIPHGLQRLPHGG